MNATSASEDRAIQTAIGLCGETTSAVQGLVDIIERLDAEIAKRDNQIQALESELERRSE